MAGSSGNNPKTELVIFLQRFINRTLTKGDVVYKTNGQDELFIATVTLVCYNGQEFTGEFCANEKLAEQSAAAATLQAFSAEMATLPPKMPKARADMPGSDKQLALPEPTNNKTELVKALQAHCRRAMTKTDVAYEMAQVGEAFQATVRLHCLGDAPEYAGDVCPIEKQAEQAAAAQALLAQSTWMPARAVVAGKVADVTNPKTSLVMYIQAHTKRTLTKEDLMYSCDRIMGGGFQAVVNVAPFGHRQFVGHVDATQKGAEASAAAMALEALEAELGQAPPAKRSKPESAAGLAAAVRQGLLPASPWVPTAGMPVLTWDAAAAVPPGGSLGAAVVTAKQPRATRAAAAVDCGPRRTVVVDVTGEVLEWNPSGYGFIKAHTNIDDPAAKLRGGRIFVHIKDMAPGCPPLSKGNVVQFSVYADTKGLGAAEVNFLM